ncbi:hypothetical protein V8E55_004598 [Tylopilus felleus]
MALLPQFLLKLVKIDGIALLDHIANENDIFLAEDARMSNGTGIGIRVGDGANFFVEPEHIVSKHFLDTKDTTDVFDGAALFIKNEDLVFCVIGDSVSWHGMGDGSEGKRDSLPAAHSLRQVRGPGIGNF